MAQTGHLTNLHATERSWWGMGADVFINQMIELGIPKDKLVLGAAFYGRGWEGSEFDGSLPLLISHQKKAPALEPVSLATLCIGI